MFHQDQQQMVETIKLLYTLNSMAITTIKVTDLISPSYVDLIPNQVYNLLVNENGKTIDIRCRVISKSKNRILIFKLQG